MNHILCFNLVLISTLPPILYAQDFWQPTGGPYGGGIYALAFHPNSDIFAGTNDNGLLCSKDNGETWRVLKNGLPGHFSLEFELAINSKGHIFAGGWGSVYRSTDGGQNWLNTELNDYVYSLAVNSSDHIFAGAYGAIYRSIDNGDTWTPVYTVPETYVRALCVNLNNHVFASLAHSSGREMGIYRSTDNGQTWAKTNLQNERAYALIVDAHNTLFAGTYHGVFRSADEGETWESADSPIWEVYTLAVDGQDQIFIGGLTGQIYFSSTRGDRPWIKSFQSMVPILSLAASTDNTLLAGSLGLGVLRSLDHGTNWEQAGIAATRINSFAEDMAGAVYVCATDQSVGGVFKWQYGRNNWEPLLQRQLNFLTMLVYPNGDLFVGYSSFDQGGYGGLLHSTDRGNSWTEQLPGRDVRVLTTDQQGNILSGTYRGIFKTTDRGQSWLPWGLPGIPIQAMNIDSHGHIFASTFLRNTTFVSRDSGKTWSQIDFLNGTGVRSIASAINNRVFVGTERAGVWRSDNDGVDWIRAGLNGSLVNTLLVQDNEKIFAGTHDRGVLISSNNGSDWTTFNSGLVDTNVISFFIGRNGYLYAGTAQTGVWRSASPVTAIEENRNHIPFTFSLEQNYPNPFNPSTTIQFSLLRSDYVTLKIYNTLGEEMATLAAKNFSAGKQQVVWEAKGMASGIYFYRLQAGDFVQTRKLVLVR